MEDPEKTAWEPSSPECSRLLTRAELDALPESVARGRARRILREQNSKHIESSTRNTLDETDRIHNASKNLDSFVVAATRGDVALSSLGMAQGRVARWGAAAYKDHRVNHWDRVRSGEAEVDLIGRQHRAEKGKMQLDHSEATHVLEVYEESCRSSGTVANTRAKRELLEEKCDLAHAALGRAGVAAIGLAMQINTTVTHLDLRDNDIDELGFKDLMQGLMDNAGLRFLDLSGNPGPGLLGIEALCNILDPHVRKQPTIVELRLARCQVTSVQGAALVRALANNHSVKTLDVSHNALGAETARALPDFFEENSVCSSLDLSYNLFTHSSAKEIADGVRDNITVRRLILRNNGLEEAGCVALGEMLGVNAGIEEMDLSCTRMGPAAALVMAASLGRNTTLRTLHLSHNPLGERGGQRLLAALDTSDTLRAISMHGAQLNSAPADVAESLRQREAVRRAAEVAKGDVKKNKKTGASSKKGGKSAPPPLLPPITSKFDPGGFTFDPGHPDGRYVLNLDRPVEFSIAAKLLQLEESGPGQNIVNVTYRGKQMTEDPLAKGWPGAMPTRGVLQFDFVTREGAPPGSKTIAPDTLENMRREVGHPTSTPMERLDAVRLVCTSYFFSCKQGAALLSEIDHGHERIEAAAVMVPRVVDAGALADLIAPLAASEQEAFYSRIGIHATFHPANPAGHYELDLSLRMDYQLANRLVALSVADGGTHVINWRNVLFDGKPSYFCTIGPEEWLGVVPRAGKLRFDYIASLGLVNSDGNAIATGTKLATTELDDALKAMRDVEVGSLAEMFEDVGRESADYGCDHLGRLRAAGVNRTVTCRQVVTLVDALHVSAARCEAAVCLFGICVDRGENWWRVLDALRGLEQSRVVTRLGFPMAHDPTKRLSMHYVLDCANPEHAEVARTLCAAASEVSWRALRNLLIAGKRPEVEVTEGARLWEDLCALGGSATPHLEVDFCGADIWEHLNVAPMMDEDARRRFLDNHAARLQADLTRQMHPYHLQLIAAMHGLSASGSLLGVDSMYTVRGKESGDTAWRLAGASPHDVAPPPFPVVESPWFAPACGVGEGKSMTMAYQFDWEEAARRKCAMEMPQNHSGAPSCPLRELWKELEPDPASDLLPSGVHAMTALQRLTGATFEEEAVMSCCRAPIVRRESSSRVRAVAAAASDITRAGSCRDGPLSWGGFETLFMMTDFLKPDPDPGAAAAAAAVVAAEEAAIETAMEAVAAAAAASKKKGKKGKGGKKGKKKGAEVEAPRPPPPPPPPLRGPPLSFPGLPRVSATAAAPELVGLDRETIAKMSTRHVAGQLSGKALLRAAARVVDLATRTLSNGQSTLESRSTRG